MHDISYVHELKNTNEISSSTNKPLKFAFGINNNQEPAVPKYILFISYQDGTDLQAGETISFNLTPDKNSTLDIIK